MAVKVEADRLNNSAVAQRRLSRFAIPLIALLIGIGIGYIVAPKGQDEAQPESVGPTRVENGVPLGYARTRDGAVAAASNFERVRSGPLLVSEEEYLRAIETMATDEWKAQALDSGRAAVTIARDQFGAAFKIETSPIRYRIISYSPSVARVSVWLVSVVSSADQRTRDIWSTVEYELRWSGDWRVAGAKSFDTLVPEPFSGPNTPADSPLDNFDSYEKAPSP